MWLELMAMKNLKVSGFAVVATLMLVMIYILGSIFFSRSKISEQHEFQFETYKFTMITAAAASTVYQNVTLPDGKQELEPVCMLQSPAGFSIVRVDETRARCSVPASEVPLQPFVLKH